MVPSARVDLRALNSNRVVDCHPLTNISEKLLTLKEARIFMTLDLSSVYHQILSVEVSHMNTAFITPEGLFQFKRMPFGLASAASVFQRMMHGIFRKTRGCYLQDDIAIYGKDESKHDIILKKSSRKTSMKWTYRSKKKCQFHTNSVTYVGHMISEWHKPKPDLVKATPKPDNKDKH